jgi:preprotein translocase subunit SecG
VGFLIGVLNVVIIILSLFLIGIILIQRGKGGGLAGAFGGAGGSSAFGTKAGDVFTRITVGVAIGWILLLMIMVILTNQYTGSAFGDSPASSVSKEFDSKASKSKATSSSPKSSSPAKPASSETDSPLDIPVIPDTPAPKK